MIQMPEQTKLPERLFRYFSPSYSHIFTEQRLWFSSPEDFNDVFEAVPRYDKLIVDSLEIFVRKLYDNLPSESRIGFNEFRVSQAAQIKQLEQGLNEAAPEAFQTKISKHYGIVCFTEHLNNLLMWGHYTGCHRGFVVEFDPQHSLFSSNALGKVSYDISRPVMNLETNVGIFLHKSIDWKYEDEHRLVKKKSELMQGRYFYNGTEKSGYYLPLPIDSIKAVYLGCRASTELRTEILKSLEPHPHVEKFFMRRNRIEYKLEVVPLTEWKQPNELVSIIQSLPWTTVPD